MSLSANDAVPLRYLVREIDERTGDVDLPLLAVTLSAGVVRRDRLTDDEPRADDLGAYKRCLQGDIVINRMRAFQGALGVAPEPGLVSPDYAILRPTVRVESRFVSYALASSSGTAEMAARIRGIGGTANSAVRTPRVNVRDLGSIPIWLPERRSQARIIEFLDRECARIDDLSVEIAEAEKVAAEQLANWFHRHLEELGGPPLVSLRRFLVSIADGPFGSSLASEHYVEDGEIRVVRLGNVGRGQFVDDDRAYVAREYAEKALSTHLLADGDVVIAGLGDTNNPLGRACVVRPDILPAIHKADCYRAVIDTRRCVPEYLALALSFGPATAVAPLLSRGSTRSRLNLVVARDLPVPFLDLEQQRGAVEAFTHERAATERLAREYQGLRVGLVDYRNALIDEAVTGRLDVSAISEPRIAESVGAVVEHGTPEILSR